MSRTIAQRELRNDNAKIMDAVARGETFVVTRNGEPIAEIRPLERARRTVVPREELAAVFGGGVRIDARRFRHDLDRAFDQELR